MEEEKAQRLVDTLSKLKKSAGLGVGGSSFHFAGENAIETELNQDGKLVRADGLPVNALYSNFMRSGSYDPNASTTRGKNIKRNFDDCVDESKEQIGETMNGKRRKLSKDEKKEAKKKAKLEAKRQAKLEEKRKAKLEEKRKAKIEAKRRAKAAETSDKTIKVEKDNDEVNEKDIIAVKKRGKKVKKEKKEKKKKSKS